MTNLSKQTILDVKIGNVIGEYTYDKVILVGSYLYQDSSYVENVDIVINPGEGGAAITTKVPYTGYNLELFIGDFNGDKKDEIMLRGEFGGTGGYAIAAIYDYRDGKLVEIFNPDMFSEKYILTSKYLDNYKVLVNSVSLKESYTFDISKRPKIYLDIIYDENGKAKENEIPIISAINGAFPIKVVFEKNYYLFIRQRVIGVSNADTIGYIESFVNLLDNNIKIVQMGAYHFGEKENSDRGKLNKITDNLPKGATLIPIQDFGWNKDKIEVDLDFDGEKEYLIPYKLKEVPYLAVLKRENNDYTLINTFKGEGYNIKDLILKKIGKEYCIFLGLEIGDNEYKIEELRYINGMLLKNSKYKI